MRCSCGHYVYVHKLPNLCLDCPDGICRDELDPDRLSPAIQPGVYDKMITRLPGSDPLERE